jgi:hypothetical protein
MTDGVVDQPATEDDPLKVNATADKQLFVSMLVKDIELLPAIIDLVDNSVDGARATTPGDPAAHHVALSISPDTFDITDDCGGIDLDVARRYAFRFGRPAEYSGVPGSVGEFGIGMKRALFKLGREFTVISRAATTSFELYINVDGWLADDDPDWQFRMRIINTTYDSAHGGVGTSISVRGLYDNVIEDFSNPLILAQLREQIRLRHQGVIQQGLQITLNGEVLTGFAPTLMSGPGITAQNRRLVITQDGGEVHCHIIAGIAALAGNANIDEGQAEDFRDPGDAGWWLFCNGRLLLLADRTSLTGWGDGLVAYHPQYRRFRGYVYLTSLNTELLPWNTTKTGVDQDSRVWRRVQSYMKVALAEVVAVLNRLKAERQNGQTTTDTPVTLALENANPVPLEQLPTANNFVAPPPPPRPPRRRSVRRIQYDVDIKRYNEVADVMGVTVVSEVGRRTFDYFYELEVEGGADD